MKKSEKTIIEEPQPGPTRKLHRNLEARHLQMIALGGTIGTGLFVGSGTSISLAGPLGVIIAYVVVGILAYSVVSAVGEMSTQVPVTGAFGELSARFLDPGVGFTLGWSYYWIWLLCITAELSAFGQICVFWAPDLKPWYFTIVGIAMLAGINCFGVKTYGELVAITLFIIAGIAIACGASPKLGVLGFSFWDPSIVPEAPIKDVLSVMNAFTVAFYSYSGCEIIGVTSGEAKNPKTSIPRAIKGTFWRILIFYVVSLTVIGMVIRMDDPQLTDKNVRSSPFTRVLDFAGISFAPDLMNAVVLLAIFSAANGAVYTTTRTLQALAANGMAPDVLVRTTKNGVPLNSILISLSFGAIALIGGYFGDAAVFDFISTVLSATTLFNWSAILATHLRFRWAWRQQGRKDEELVYKSPFYPYFDIFGLVIGFIVLVFLFIRTATSPFHWIEDSPFYIGVPAFILPYFGYKFYYNQGFGLVKFENMDFDANPNGGILKTEDEEKKDIAEVSFLQKTWNRILDVV